MDINESATDPTPNTVRYRLQRIATTTGHDPRTFAGLVELLCVLEMIGEDRHGRQ